MPDLDIEPKRVRFWDHKTARWQTRIGRKFARGYAFFCLAVLALIFWYRGDLAADPALLFGLTAAFALGAGVMLANWLFDLY